MCQTTIMSYIMDFSIQEVLKGLSCVFLSGDKQILGGVITDYKRLLTAILESAVR